MAKKKTQSDTERFARYQSVLNILLSIDSFDKAEIYQALKDEKKAFIGRTIGELVRNGYREAGKMAGPDPQAPEKNTC
ncbi:MAG: hypothetical protein ACYTEW_25525 [Planctomycetota bacterium]|jgi:hypothetical protein